MFLNYGQEGTAAKLLEWLWFIGSHFIGEIMGGNLWEGIVQAAVKATL